jgi:hypothetical protein
MKRALLILVVLALPSGVSAQGDASEARRLFEQGVTAADHERWEEAIDLFRRSAQIVERPGTSYNLAVALDHLGRAREARAALEDYFRLAGDHDSRNADAVALRTQLDRRVARLALTVHPESATVRIDGEEQQGSGAERAIVLDPGDHTVEVSAEGVEPQTIQVSATAGASISRTVDLAGEHRVAHDEGHPAPSGGGGLHTLGIVGLIVAGFGVASGVVAIGTGVASNDTYTYLNTQCAADGTCPASVQPTIDSGRALAWTSTIFTIVAGLAGIAGVSLLIVDLTSGGGSNNARLELAPGPTLAGLSGRLRFF